MQRSLPNRAAAGLVAVGVLAGCGDRLDAWRPDPPSSQVVSGAAPPLRLLVDSAHSQLILELSPLQLTGGAAAGEPHHMHDWTDDATDEQAQHGHHAMARTPLEKARLPFDAWLTGFSAELSDAAGNPLPQAMLHHVNVMLPDRRDLFRPIMQRLAAAGEETAPVELPWPFGVPAHAGQLVAVYAMVHDPDGLADGAVTVRVRIRYQRGGHRIAVQPFFIDASPPPGPAGWDLPPGRSTRSWEGSPATPARILAVGGHLHRFGRELILEDVAAGRVLVRLRPQYAEDGEITGVERRRFIARLGVALRPGRQYRITAVYDNPTGDTIPAGAMGAIGGMVRSRTRPWPAAPAGDPLYAEDLALLRGEHAAHAH